MDPSCLDHVFLISCVHCVIVFCFAVSMETLSTTASVRGAPDDSIADDSFKERLEAFMDAPCPPVNNLHLLCDVTIGTSTTCEERALIIDKCLYRFKNLYTNSKWDTCLSETNCCDKIIVLLQRRKYIPAISTNDRKHNIYCTGKRKSTDSKSTEGSVKTSTSLNTTFYDVISTSVTKVTPLSNRTPVSTENMDTKELDSTNTFPEVSVILPVIGTLCIMIEVVVLCAFCYKKKKGPQYQKQRRPSTGSGGVQEEALTPQTANTVKSSPRMNSHLTEDDAMKEDQNIFNSYMNLRYIDENEEPTPAKKLLKS